MRIAIAGGTGRAGSRAADSARARGHDVVVLARSVGIDLITGEGVPQALDGVDAVIDASGSGAKDDPTAFHEAVTRTLAAAKPPHIVVLSIVGCDRATAFPLYAGKVAQEQASVASGIPFSIARVTQFHEFSAQLWDFGKRGPVHFAPRGRSRPVAVREVGERLVALAEAGPSGRAPDFGGPREESFVDMVKAYARATGRKGWIVPVSLRGELGRAQRDGSLLPGEGAECGMQTFDEWIAELATSDVSRAG
jgi:uncharacterized protein YbjT (DUF2867 family)